MFDWVGSQLRFYFKLSKNLEVMLFTISDDHHMSFSKVTGSWIFFFGDLTLYPSCPFENAFRQ
jgi:hypothetical protein